MRRRDLLVTTGVALAAGCQNQPGGQPEPTPTSRPTDESTEAPTATPTPDSPAPTVENVSLVSTWEEAGDLEANAIDAAAPVGDIKLAVRYTMPIHSGAIQPRTQMTVYDEEDSRVATQTEEEERLTDESGVAIWENDVVFDASDWDRGEYTVETIIRDNETERTSDTTTTSFELTEPITTVEVTNIDAPNSIGVGEPYQFTLTIENTSGRDGTFQSRLSYRIGGDFQGIGTFNLTLADGQARDWTLDEVELDQTGEITFRLDETGDEWILMVEN